MSNFSKGKEKFIITDDQAMVQAYKASPPKTDQIKLRSKHTSNQISVLISAVSGALSQGVVQEMMMDGVGQLIKNRTYLIDGHYHTMEITRLDFDSYGRLK